MKKVRKLQIIMLVFLDFILINYEIYILVSSNSNFTLSLEKGSQFLEVINYDEQAWKDTINITSNPTDWFGGESDIIGAKRKNTIMGWHESKLFTLGFFDRFFQWFDIDFYSTLSNTCYGYEYIMDNYPTNYYIWGYDFTFWSFRTEPFDNYSESIMEDSLILRNPSNFKNILDDYNEFAIIINNDTTLQTLNLSLPTLNGDEFLWNLVMHGFTLASPINNYLTEIINALECENVSVNENTLIFSRNGEKDYIVEFIYNSLGKLDTVIVKDYDDKLIYEINSTYPKFTALIILGIISGVILGLVGFNVYRKKRLKKKYT